MDYRALFKGQFIAAAEFGGKTPTLTIASVKIVKLESLSMGDDDGAAKKERDRGVVYFRETDRGWVLNRTNAESLAGMFGIETDNWIGKRVTLYATEVQVGRKREPGIRVKGSPDIERPITVTIRLPRKKPVQMTMHVTGKSAKPSAPPTGDVDPNTGEVAPPFEGE